MTTASSTAGEVERIWNPRSGSVVRRSAWLVSALSALCVMSAGAEALSSGPPDCGGDAFSSAEVIEKRPARHGPLTAVPQTLCADLTPQQPPANVEIGIFPSLAPRHGMPGPSAPYEAWPAGRGGPARP